MFSKAERESLRISLENIQINFIYQIGIMMEEDPVEENKHTRHVEITWVGHSFPNYLEVVENCKNPLEIKNHMDQEGGPRILNYRFIKDFTKGVENTWSINALNHFLILSPNYQS